jgi:HK97 family phage major capsid protein
MSDSALTAVRKLKDSNNRYLLQWDYAAGQPATILGKPVTVDPYLPAVAAGAKHTVYGDFNAGFGVRRVAGINIKYLQELYAASGLVGWRLDVAVDSRLLDSAALTVYKQAAS